MINIYIINMVKIYCIEDINGLKYIGKTNQKKLSDRLSQHKCNKKCSSNLLDLNNCKIYLLEENDEDKEQYWINKIDCVNLNNSIRDVSKYKIKRKIWFVNNKDRLKEYKKQRYKYYSSWGDNRYHNCMLDIDVNLFN